METGVSVGMGDHVTGVDTKGGHIYNVVNMICDQVWENHSKCHVLCFEKYLFEIFNALSFSCGTIQSR